MVPIYFHRNQMKLLMILFEQLFIFLLEIWIDFHFSEHGSNVTSILVWLALIFFFFFLQVRTFKDFQNLLWLRKKLIMEWQDMWSSVPLKPRPETEKVLVLSIVCSVTSWDKLATFRSSIVAMHSIPKIRPFKYLLGT